MKKSIYSNTFFWHSKKGCNEILEFGYKWLCRTTYAELMHHFGWSSATVTNWIGYYLQLTSDAITEEEMVIGGEGIIVQIDESKFASRKYNRGYRKGDGL